MLPAVAIIAAGGRPGTTGCAVTLLAPSAGLIKKNVIVSDPSSPQTKLMSPVAAATGSGVAVTVGVVAGPGVGVAVTAVAGPTSPAATQKPPEPRMQGVGVGSGVPGVAVAVAVAVAVGAGAAVGAAAVLGTGVFVGAGVAVAAAASVASPVVSPPSGVGVVTDSALSAPSTRSDVLSAAVGTAVGIGVGTEIVGAGSTGTAVATGTGVGSGAVVGFAETSNSDVSVVSPPRVRTNASRNTSRAARIATKIRAPVSRLRSHHQAFEKMLLFITSSLV